MRGRGRPVALARRCGIAPASVAARLDRVTANLRLFEVLGIEGGSLAKMPGLIREARDLEAIAQGAEKARAPREAAGKDGASKPPETRGGGDGSSGPAA